MSKKLLLPAIAMCYACVLPVRAAVNEPANWQFFQTPDGLVESYVDRVESGHNGRLWLTYGVEKLSWMDGWPDEDGHLVHTEEIKGFGVNPFIKEADSGALWCFSPRGILIRRNNLHRTFPVDEYSGLIPEINADSAGRFQPLDHKRFLYLRPDHLDLIDLAALKKTIFQRAIATRLGSFINITSARNGQYWITGERGVALFDPEADKYWREFLPDTSGLVHFRDPTVSTSGSLVMLANNARTGATVIVEFDGRKWLVNRHVSGTVLECWRVDDSGYWLWKDDNTLSVLRGAVEEVQDKVGILSGDFRDLAVVGSGVFWVATSHGAARYSPSIWQIPGPVKSCVNRVHAIHEDPQGRVWFAAMDDLLLYQNGEWKIYNLPEGKQTQSYATRSMCSLPDGRLALSTESYNDQITVFDPRSEKFVDIPYVSADSAERGKPRSISRITPRRDGSAWVRVVFDTDPLESFRLETFDGEKFHSSLYIEHAWNIGFPRFIEETVDGSVWVGWVASDTSGLMRYRNGEMEFVTDFEGYQSDGIFSFCEVEKGKIWAGGRDAVQEFDGEKWRMVISGIAAVRSIFMGGDGSVWVASGTGIHRYVNGSWVTNTAEDGLANTATYSVLEDSRGQVWVGTIQGLNRFHPEADVDAPRTLIPAWENLQMAPPSGPVRLNFYGMDRWKQTRSERLLFSHRLDGGSWSPFTGKNMVVYDKLSHGPHRFEVRSMDVNFNIDPVPSTFEFTVLEPWYDETGFRITAGLGAAVIIILLGYATHRHFMLEKLVVKRTSALQLVNVELESKMAELKRTRSKLLDSQKMEIIGKVASGVAHEVRNPLNAILAVSEALNEEIGGKAEYRDYLEHIHIQVDRLSTLMNDLLDLGKPMKKETFDPQSIKTVCSEAVELCRKSSSLGNCRLSFDGSRVDGELIVLGDAVKLKQVILNLVDNSAQHSPEGGEIKVSLIQENEMTVTISVRDHGSGIDPEIMPEVMKPFFTTRARGTGLGLSIVQSIIETHGGSFELLNNDPPPGLTVKVSLPLYMR